MTDKQTVAVPYEVYKRQEYQGVMEEAAKSNLDVAPAGGRYEAADGAIVDANGKPVKEQPKAADKRAEGDAPAQRATR